MNKGRDEQGVADYLGRHAPELDREEVIEFMKEHDKPEHEKGLHIEWAVRALRERREGEHHDGPSIDQIVDEMRRHDAR